jgi:hypothetical protein
MAGYTRQSSASIVNGSAITAPPLNAEFNQILAAFASSSGHAHTGATGDGPKIALATSVSGYLPVANGGVAGKNNTTATSVPGVGDDSADGYAPGSIWENTSTGRIYICVGNNSGAAVWRELVQVTSLNAILPVSNDSVDIGSNSLRYQDLFLSGGIAAAGNVAAGGTLTMTGGTALNDTLTVTGVTALNGGLTMDSNKFTVANGTGNTAVAGTFAVTGNATAGGTFGVTGNTTVGGTFGATGNAALGGTLAVTGTSAFTGAITSNAGVIVDNITIDGTEIDLSSGDLTIDVAGDILLNADGGDIFLQDGSATFGSLTNNSGQLIIKSATTTAATFAGANVDFSGTVDVTGAATLDSTLAVAGVLSPATHVDMPDNAVIKVGTGDDLEISHDGTNSLISNKTGILKVATETSGIAVTIGHTTSEVTIGDNLTVAGNLTVQGSQIVVDTVTMNAANAIVFEGATADDHETTLTIVDPTADRTINLPNQSGTVPLLAAASNDTISATPAELSIMDGDKSAVSTTLAAADRVVVNDAGTMKQVALSDFETFMETNLDTLANVTEVGALNAGTITSGFGTIDTGSSAITTTGAVNFGSLADGTITITGFVDEDNMASNSATLIPTQQSVEARIQSVSGAANNIVGLTATADELNILDDATLTTAEINVLDGSATTQATVTLVGTDGVVISDADVMKQALVSDFDTYMASTTKTLTNKTLASGSITSGFGSIDTGASTITTTGLISGGSLDIDNVLIDGATIGHTDDTDLITLSNGVVTVAGELDATTLDISGAIDVAGNSVLASVDVTGVATAATFEPDGDTAAGDNAAIGYTAAEGLILTGQGATGDVTIKNDADALVAHVPTGTTGVTFAGAIDVAGTANLDAVDIDGAVDMAQTLQVDGIATFSAIPVANVGLSVKNGSTSGGFVQFFEDSSDGTSNVKVIAPALAGDISVTLPTAAGILATIDDATALSIALG